MADSNENYRFLVDAHTPSNGAGGRAHVHSSHPETSSPSAAANERMTIALIGPD
jgi:hypothetical protein